jgi:hypothetical protein
MAGVTISSAFGPHNANRGFALAFFATPVSATPRPVDAARNQRTSFPVDLWDVRTPSILEGNLMNECNADPSFEVRRLKSAPGWYVRAAWAHGKRDHIPGFMSEQEAQRWIETKARGWVAEQTRVSFKGIAA